MVEYPKTCPTCGKNFIVRNKFVAITRNRTYCSYECKQRKIPINDRYFNELDNSKLHTLGQIVATSYIESSDVMILRTDLDTIDKIKTVLDSKHIPTKADHGLWCLRICSKRIIDDFLSVPLSTNQYYQEFPPYDCLSGILDTHWYRDGEFRHYSHRLVLGVQERLGGEIRTETFKEVYKGVMGCHWVLGSI